MLMASKYASKGAGCLLQSILARAYPSSARAAWVRISRSSSMSNLLPDTLSPSAMKSRSWLTTYRTSAALGSAVRTNGTSRMNSLLWLTSARCSNHFT